MKITWNQSSKYEKCLWVLQLLVSAAVIVLVILKLLDIYAEAMNWAVPLLGVLQVIQGTREWKQNKVLAVISFAVAIFVFACTVAVWLLK